MTELVEATTPTPATPEPGLPRATPAAAPADRAETADRADPGDSGDSGDSGDPAALAAAAEAGRVADAVFGLMRVLRQTKAQALQAAAKDSEWSAGNVLRCLQTEGPQRSGAVAELLHADPSTISRQVAGLIKDGLIERQADPDDGRASLLVLTPKAAGVLDAQKRVRNAYFADMLAQWPNADRDHFVELLARFTDDFAAKHDNWMTERGGRDGREGSSDR